MQEARERLAAGIECRHSRYADGPSDPCPSLVRVEVPVVGVPPLMWLNAQPGPMKTYWTSRDGLFETAGVGVCDLLSGSDVGDFEAAYAELTGVLSSGSDLVRYYGGIRFDGASSGLREAGPWQGFAAFRFVLPRFELVRRLDDTALVCNMRVRPHPPDVASLRSELDGLVDSLESADAALPVIVDRSDLPDAIGWKSAVDQALEAIRAADIQKVVLASVTTLLMGGPLNPVAVLLRLAPSPLCYRFCFQFDHEHAFVGATPERLYARSGPDIHSEAIGGTRPRGATPSKDDSLGRELLESAKDRLEHQWVADAVVEKLAGLCGSLRSDEGASLLRLATMQHLVTRFVGTLAAGLSDVDILQAMHPTPAVGGYPAERALEIIRRIEPFDRGWYAGPVGWIGRQNAEFAVAIRSGLIARERLLVYAGAGIVDGSIAAGERDEIETKIAGFLKAFES